MGMEQSQTSEQNLNLMTSSHAASGASPTKVPEIRPTNYQIKSDADFRRDHANSQQPLNPDLGLVGQRSQARNHFSKSPARAANLPQMSDELKRNLGKQFGLNIAGLNTARGMQSQPDVLGGFINNIGIRGTQGSQHNLGFTIGGPASQMMHQPAYQSRRNLG